MPDICFITSKTSTMYTGLLTSTERVGRAMLALLQQADPPPVVENDEINRLGA